MSRGTTENFEVQNLENATLQLPALQELENLAILIEGQENPIAKMKDEAVIERYIEIMDPENWVRLFPPSVLEKYRDIDGHPLAGNDYQERVEALFDRFINPVGTAFGSFVTTKESCERLCGDQVWSKMYQTLCKWDTYRHYFFYAGDPFDSVKPMNKPL